MFGISAQRVQMRVQMSAPTKNILNRCPAKAYYPMI